MTNYEITKEYFAKLNINDEIFDTIDILIEIIKNGSKRCKILIK